MPGTAEFDRLQEELAFSMAHIEAPTTRELHQRLADHIRRFMVKRNCWPVGTRVKVRRGFKVETVFPDER
jgi:hypothetical protein